MKNNLTILILLVLTLFSSCSDEETVNLSEVNFKFSHNWDGVEVSNTDFNTLKFINANGETLSIERLRYLISRITLTDTNGREIPFTGYNLIDVTNNLNLTYTLPQKIKDGTYEVNFVFGFNDQDNIDGVYQDLNSVSWNVPGMLGGGYHYMQFDGKYTNTSATNPANFNYHAIRAVDRSDPNNLKFQDTSFQVNLGTIIISGNSEIEVKMNIAEWFKNPNTWDLTVLNTVLMPNFNAQILMNENGKTVFSLGEIN